MATKFYFQYFNITNLSNISKFAFVFNFCSFSEPMDLKGPIKLEDPGDGLMKRLDRQNGFEHNNIATLGNFSILNCHISRFLIEFIDLPRF